MSDEQKYRAAEAAMAEVTSGMRLGLGTGSTAKHFVDIVGRAVQNGPRRHLRPDLRSHGRAGAEPRHPAHRPRDHA